MKKYTFLLKYFQNILEKVIAVSKLIPIFVLLEGDKKRNPVQK